MPNRSNYARQSRAIEPAAAAPRPRIIGTVNPYWLQQAEKRKRKSASRKLASLTNKK